MADARELARRFQDAINAGDEAALLDLLHEDFVDHTPNPSHGATRADFVTQKMRGLRASFSDLQLRVEQVVAEGDTVAVLWTMTGTNDGPFAGEDATGSFIRFSGMNLERIEDGRIAEHWSVYDSQTLFHQLGRLG